jgi:hypothetical protein
MSADEITRQHNGKLKMFHEITRQHNGKLKMFQLIHPYEGFLSIHVLHFWNFDINPTQVPNGEKGYYIL